MAFTTNNRRPGMLCRCQRHLRTPGKPDCWECLAEKMHAMRSDGDHPKGPERREFIDAVNEDVHAAGPWDGDNGDSIRLMRR